jgi:hypothetical protein
MHVTYKVYDWLKNYFFCALRVVTNSLIGWNLFCACAHSAQLFRYQHL